jgi:lipopolysaccharide/colanic/teichoic acid biosynthesis glycosyltransferase
MGKTGGDRQMEHSGDSRAVADAPTPAADSAQVDEATTNGQRNAAALRRTQPYLAPPALSRAKRSLDMALSLVALPIAAPVGLVIALLVKTTSRGPVLFKQRRIGLGGATIEVLKFRTMHDDAEERLRNDPVLRDEFVRNGYKLHDDPRLTGLGRWLRKFSLDELPQIFNVLAGSMSWVGPRPILLEELEQDLDLSAYLSVRPGLTGWWQVSGRSNVDRPTHDREYVEAWSFWLDVKILLKTPLAVLTSRGAV